MIAATYVINLQRSAGRWRAMQDVLRIMRVPNPQRFDAVDGAALDDDRIAALQASGELATDLSRFEAGRVSGEIGCALSHRGVLADIVARQLPAALILEDDIALRRPLRSWHRRFSEALAELPGDWELWYLYRCFDIAHRATRRSPRIVVPWSPQGAAAYAVTLAGATKLLGALTPIGDAVDRIYAGLVRSRQITAYAASPQLVLPGTQPSIIDDGSEVKDWVRNGINTPPEYWPKKYFRYLGETAPRGLFYWRQDIVNFCDGVRYRLRQWASRP